MTKPTFDFWCTTMALTPPIGGLAFAAKAHVVRTDSGRGVPVGHDFGECLGKTKSDAEAKMRGKVLDWIKEQEDAAPP